MFTYNSLVKYKDDPIGPGNIWRVTSNGMKQKKSEVHMVNITGQSVTVSNKIVEEVDPGKLSFPELLLHVPGTVLREDSGTCGGSLFDDVTRYYHPEERISTVRHPYNDPPSRALAETLNNGRMTLSLYAILAVSYSPIFCLIPIANIAQKHEKNQDIDLLVHRIYGVLNKLTGKVYITPEELRDATGQIYIHSLPPTIIRECMPYALPPGARALDRQVFLEQGIYRFELFAHTLPRAYVLSLIRDGKLHTIFADNGVL